MAMATQGGDEIRIGDLTDHELIGEGACGAVFRVKDPQGCTLALKLLDDAAVNRGLLESTTRRLRAGGWPDGVMPVVACDFAGAPAFLLSPLTADETADGAVVPRSLQYRLDEYPGLDAWKIVKAIARALAAMHARHVPHGNLKPGNVFFDANGSIQLRDWALGHMPGVQKDDFTDALLYQPPEQLRDAAVIAADGFRCDVFAFGVMAFRLLTGKFPRCHATFSQVAPPPGKTRTEGIRADLGKIASNIEAQHGFQWPEEARGELERELRGWIDRCLAIDPEQRPRDMIEVAAGLAGSEPPAAAEVVAGEGRDERRHAAVNARRSYFALAGAAAVAALLAVAWHHRGTQIADQRTRHAGELRELHAGLDSMTAAKEAAESQAAETARVLADERQIWLAGLSASQRVNDRLFAWLLEEDHRRMPPLDGRELRLRQLERQLVAFIEGDGDLPDLVEERALARLRLAEISLALDDAESAATRLDDAARIWESQPMNSALRLRMAADRLWLALLWQESAKPEAAAAFTKAREALSAVPRADVDATRLDHLLALLDLRESALHAARGDDTRALEQLMRATQTLNRIAGERPDAAILHSELAASHLSTATILEAIGHPDDALNVRQRALQELGEIHRKNPANAALALELAGCHGAVAEAAMLEGDPGAAEPQITAAEKLLAGLGASEAASSGATLLKASLLGLRAGMARDRGQAEMALGIYDEALRLIESLRASASTDAMPAYRLALLWWQKGRLLGDTGKRDEEIALLSQARDLLTSLDRPDAVNGPMPEEIRRAAAYLAGDLGHALQIANRGGDAARAFDHAVSLWEKLAAARPERGEYQEGLEWSRQRRGDLK